MVEWSCVTIISSLWQWTKCIASLMPAEEQSNTNRPHHDPCPYSLRDGNQQSPPGQSIGVAERRPVHFTNAEVPAPSDSTARWTTARPPLSQTQACHPRTELLKIPQCHTQVTPTWRNVKIRHESLDTLNGWLRIITSPAMKRSYKRPGWVTRRLLNIMTVHI